MAVVEGRGCGMDVMNDAVEVDGGTAQSAIQGWRHIVGLMLAVGGGASGCWCLRYKLAFTCGIGFWGVGCGGSVHMGFWLSLLQESSCRMSRSSASETCCLYLLCGVVGLLDITKVFHYGLGKVEQTSATSEQLPVFMTGVQSEFGLVHSNWPLDRHS